MESSPTKNEVETNEIKESIWQNFARIASAKPRLSPAESTEKYPLRTLKTELAKLESPNSGQGKINWEEYIKLDVSHWSDWKSEVVGFTSQKVETKKVVTTMAEAQAQTLTIHVQETGVGGTENKDAKIQTELSESENTQHFENKPYPPSLFAFFSKVGERMLEALKETYSTSVHTLLEEDMFFRRQIEDEKEARFELLRSMKPTLLHRLCTGTVPEGVEAVGVSWSPSGTQVAVAYGAFQHKSFCRHQSVPITIWSLAASLLKKGPLCEILFDGCSTCIQFHPKEGNFLAVGFYSGEVGIIDLNGAEKVSMSLLQAASGDTKRRGDSSRFEFKHNDAFVGIDGSCHAQCITTIKWIHLDAKEMRLLANKNPNALPYFIVSTSLDGFIALWSVDLLTSRITLERRYAVHSRVIPESFKRSNMSDFLHLKQIGIRSWDSFKDEPTRFVCSTFGSYLFQGNLMSETKYSEDELNNPLPYLSHIYDPGAVFIIKELDYTRCVACNPFNPYLYVYATQNGEMYIRSVKFRDCEPILRTYFPNSGTFDVKWSLRPMVFGVTNQKMVFVYDLLVNESVEVFSAEHEAICRSLAWSQAETNYLAVSDSAGYVNIWRLAEELNQHNYSEIEQLNKYAEFTEYTAPLDNPEDEEASEADEDDEDEDAEYETLDLLTKNHFPILNEKIQNTRSHATEKD